MRFFNEVGPTTSVGPTYEGAYTSTAPSGDADLVASDTLWGLKVMKGRPKTRHALQLYMYYLMGKRSDEVRFLSVDRTGFFNPAFTHRGLLAHRA